MRVLILANNDIGLYKFRKELIEELVKENEVYICLPDGEFIPQLRQLGCRYIDCKLLNRHGTNPIQDLKLMQFYKNQAEELQPDIVFTYTIKPNVYGGMAAASLHVPYIATITGLGTALEGGGPLARLTTFLYKIGIKKADCVFFQNSVNSQNFYTNRIYKGKSVLVSGSGVNLEINPLEKYPPDDKEIRILFVGRIMRNKGIEELLECIGKIRLHHPRVYFDIIGNFDEEVYRQSIMQLHNEGILTYHGYQKDSHSYMKRAHAIVHPSYHEGMSNVLLEAAACGRPILASDIPGCQETYEDGVTGIAFPSKSAEALTEAIERFIALPYEQKVKMGQAGRKKVEAEFDRKIVVQQYMDEINRICKRKQENQIYDYI